MNWQGAMDSIPIFYPTQNYVSQYPSRSGQPYPGPDVTQYLKSTIPYFQGPQAPTNYPSYPAPANPKMDNFYLKYHINMNTNFDGVVPR